MDQVGVNAPGKPTNKIDLSFAKSARLCFFGGNPMCSSTLGKLSPTEAAKPRRAIPVDGGNNEEEFLPNLDTDIAREQKLLLNKNCDMV